MQFLYVFHFQEINECKGTTKSIHLAGLEGHIVEEEGGEHANIQGVLLVQAQHQFLFVCQRPPLSLQPLCERLDGHRHLEPSQAPVGEISYQVSTICLHPLTLYTGDFDVKFGMHAYMCHIA